MIERIQVAADNRTQFVDITGAINDALERMNASFGICQVFVQHTTAGVVVNENADPDVAKDMLAWLDRVVPQNDRDYDHAEGNSPAHIKSTLVGQSVTVPVESGKLVLGTWQGVYLAEFDGPRQRTLVVNLVGG